MSVLLPLSLAGDNYADLQPTGHFHDKDPVAWRPYLQIGNKLHVGRGYESRERLSNVGNMAASWLLVTGNQPFCLKTSPH